MHMPIYILRRFSNLPNVTLSYSSSTNSTFAPKIEFLVKDRKKRQLLYFSKTLIDLWGRKLSISSDNWRKTKPRQYFDLWKNVQGINIP